MAGFSSGSVLYLINVDWYFLLHWLDRAKASRDKGMVVHVATTITDSKHLLAMKEHGFIVHEVPFGRGEINLFNDIVSFCRVFCVLKRVKPSICHAITLKAVVYGGISAKILGCAVVHSIVGLGILTPRITSLDSAMWKLFKPLLKLSLSVKNSLVLFENHDDRELFVQEKIVSYASTFIIPGAGVDVNKFKPSGKCRNYSANRVFSILFAARLLKSKGLELLVDAVKNLKAMGCEVILHVAGIQDTEATDSLDLSLVEMWEKNGIIVWHGQVNCMEQLFHVCDVVCLPTLYGEGLPRVLIEAAASGKAVVASDVPGCSDFVQDKKDGEIFKAGDLKELTEILYRLSYSPEVLVRYGGAGRRKVVSNYSNSLVIRRTFSCYSKLLGVSA